MTTEKMMTVMEYGVLAGLLTIIAMDAFSEFNYKASSPAETCKHLKGEVNALSAKAGPKVQISFSCTPASAPAPVNP